MPAQFVVEARDKANNLVLEHGLVLRVVLTPGSQLQQLQQQLAAMGATLCATKYPCQVSIGSPCSLVPTDRCNQAIRAVMQPLSNTGAQQRRKECRLSGGQGPRAPPTYVPMRARSRRRRLREGSRGVDPSLRGGSGSGSGRGDSSPRSGVGAP